ncbi:hypothetical protein BDW74DRAFT_171211 [Aspergillus multicolor]|uniref:aldo/keto reductase family protein n=1 Tax=Aspergillus multicolor TaxID=41759 RepID=UPI003CCDE5C0
MSPAGLVFGGGSFMNETDYSNLEGKREALALLQAADVKTMGSAKVYQDCEKFLGQLEAPKTHAIDSKYSWAIQQGPSTKEAILESANKSLELLKTDQLDVFYFHSPDHIVPLEDQVDSVNILYKEGKIKRFGLANHNASEVEALVRVAKAKNMIVPTVHEGQYSALARRAEKDLFPILREHGIEFRAFSPIAGGLLTKDADHFEKIKTGRWNPNTMIGALYRQLFNKPSMIEALRRWEALSKETGISKVELAYRWVVNNSALDGEKGDKVIFGARNLEQLRETLGLLRMGPLDDEIVKKIHEVGNLSGGCAESRVRESL